MAYLGQGPFQEFSNPPTKDNFTGDGSTTAFDLDQEVPSGSQNALEVFVDNVRQEPGSSKAFTLGVDGSGDHKRITFTAAPANGASIYVINDKTNSTIVAPLSNDLNGTELILDVDGDTSITADTDDRIDFKIANVEHFSFSNSSGDTVIKPMVDAKDILFQQYDGRTLLDINDAGYVAIANGATGPGQLRLYEDTDNGTNFTAFQVGTQSGDITYTLPTADGSSGQFLTTNGSGVLSFDTVSSAADDLTIGDAAILLTTSAGNITIDAAGNDTDIIFKGTDGGSDRVFMTIDGSAGGDLFLTGGLIDLKNDGSAVSQIKFYCESSNAHAQTLIGAPHSESASNTLTLPSTGGDSRLLTAASTATVTNKTFTSPKINEDVAVTATATEINLIDGGTSRGTTAVASGDGILINDGGTMRMTNVDTVSTYFASHTVGGGNIVTTGALGSGSIAAGFGNIDNGASNITSGGLVSLDVDADADDVTGDSATGRLTLGAGQDLNLYHGGTNSYIVNDTGDLILKTGASDEDMIFQGNDGGSAITALTLDMSAAGAATFNSTVAATGFIIGSANIGEAELEILDGLAATTAELTIIDGNTSATSTTVADADRVVMNDNGTMVQVAVTDLAAYFDDEITAMPNLVTVGAAGTASSVAGIPFYSADTSSIYTTDVSGTDDTASGNSAYGYQAMDAITTGDANTAVGHIALGANTTGLRNTAVGSSALEVNTTGADNVAIGRSALASNTTASENIAIGKSAMEVNTTGTRNIAIGYQAYDASDTENDNLAIGYNAMTTNTAGGTLNIAIGNYALDALTSGDHNTAIGQNTLGATTTGGQNTAVGHESMLTNTTGVQNTALGRYSLYTNNADNNVAIGYSAMELNTTGARNVAVGVDALKANTTGAESVAVGYHALLDNTTGSANVAIGRQALANNTTGTENVSVGFNLYTNTTGDFNTAVGFRSLYLNATTDSNTAIGHEALYNNIAAGNTAVGKDALNANTTGTENVAMGMDALKTNTTTGRNTAVGYASLTANVAANNTGVGYGALNANTTGAGNIAVGSGAMEINTTGTRNIAIGMNAYNSSDTENDNIAIGFDAMTTNTAGGTANVAVGNYALDALTSGDANVAVGDNALSANNSGGSNTSIGHESLAANTTASNNTAVGKSSLTANTTGDANVAIGFESMITNTTGTDNTAIGKESLKANLSGTNNTALGRQALFSNTTGDSNVAVGLNSLKLNTTGTRNIAIGQSAYQNSDTENDNVAIGHNAMNTNTAGGTGNVAVGNYAGDAITSGDYNTCLGMYGGSDLTSGTNCIMLGYQAGLSNSPAHTQNGTNRIVLGNNDITDCYIKVDWSVTSDERDKMNFAEVPHGLSFVNDLKPIKFDFKKSRDDETPHGKTKYGFKAQDILALEGDNPIIINNEDENKLSVTNSHLIPVLVNAIQELSAKNDALLARIETLEG